MTTTGLASVQEQSEQTTGNAISYTALVDGVRKQFQSGKTKDLAWRRQQLEAVKRMIEENHERITAAVQGDVGGPKLRGLAELLVHGEAVEALQQLSTWTAPVPVNSGYFLSKASVRQEPKGVILHIAPWNYPISLVFQPLISMIASGNCVVIKPSEVSENSARLLAELIPKYLDGNCIKVVTGAVVETTALLKEKWDHIFFTGNGAVAKVVARAAAENLTPLTLELGGKCPAIVDPTARVQTAAHRICMGKWLNVGQTCIAPDYVVCHDSIVEELESAMRDIVAKAYGADPKTHRDFGRIINGRHVGRIKGLLEDAGAHDAAKACDASARYVPPTFLRNPPAGSRVLKEEIFGPILPILTYSTNIDEAINVVNRICREPLALYIFTEDASVASYVLDRTQSGGACVNSTLEHVGAKGMPFGGVGESGCGAYHGKAGFDEFTHRRSTLVQDTFIRRGPGFPHAPYTDGMYDFALKATVTGFLSAQQKRYLFLAATAVASAVAYGTMRSRL
ncbi:Aldehyde dehydrogenase family 3 member I1 [Diplonema papillatum]|nr:Aldehyde dehydrogenase family 3 member I1 [Diplonema papillatum]|eukprot:gene4006-6214_t